VILLMIWVYWQLMILKYLCVCLADEGSHDIVCMAREDSVICVCQVILFYDF
jgi:hypothetical protein